MKVLNLYSGLGGNRKLWANCDVTAVENHTKIAEVYKRLYPKDTLIVGDAHEYLLQNFDKFDFIWSSPPCQSHSRMNKATRHKLKRYPDMSLYQEILFLKHFAKCKWVVENVIPYYEPLVPGFKLGRHIFWANFEIKPFKMDKPKGFISGCTVEAKERMMNWLGIRYPENIYYGSNHCPVQILRNCVHPKLGEHVFKEAFGGN